MNPTGLGGLSADVETAVSGIGVKRPALGEATLANLRPVRLALTGLGPFRGSDPALFDFLTQSPDADRYPRRPCDVFVISGDNGTGKTSVLRAIHGLFDLLSSDPSGIFAELGDGAADKLVGKCRLLPSARLDLFADCSIAGKARRVLITLWHGADQPPEEQEGTAWLDMLCDGRERILIGFAHGTRVASGTNASGHHILGAIRSLEGTPITDDNPDGSLAAGLRPLPMAMHFRDGPRTNGRATGRPPSTNPGYIPAREFYLSESLGSEVPPRFRRYGLMPLKAWLDELTEGAFLNPVPRSEFTVRPGRRLMVDRGRLEGHGLVELGSGETALLALHGNGWLHMTNGALLLIDAIDDRIARKWHEKVAMTTLRLAMGRAGAMLILATRNPRFADMIAASAAEVGLAYAGTSVINDLYS